MSLSVDKVSENSGNSKFGVRFIENDDEVGVKKIKITQTASANQQIQQ